MRLPKENSRNSSLFIPLLFASIISFIFTFLVFLFTFHYGSPYDLKIELIAIAILAVWLVLLVFSRQGAKDHKKVKLVVICVFFSIAAIYMANMVWNYGYLQADIYKAMAKGKMNADSLFHWTLAQGIQNYGYPTLLISTPSFSNYHFFSHVFMSAISVISKVSIPFVYTYLYPIIFFPIYGFLILAVAQKFRYYFHIDTPISFWDVFILMVFLVGFLPYSWLDSMALWRGSWVLSESFFIGLIVVLFYLYCLLTAYQRGWFQKKWLYMVFLLLLNPLFIVLAYFSKLTLGVLLLAGIAFYFFRTRMRNMKYWVLNGYYALIFLAVWYIPLLINTQVKSIAQIFEFSLFGFMRTYVPFKYWALHIVLLFLFTTFVVWFRYRNETSLKSSIVSKEHTPEEILLVISILGFLPGLILNIAGGSAVYFSYVQMLGATVLLIGYNIPHTVISAVSRKAGNKVLIAILTLCISFTFCYNATSGLTPASHTFSGLLKQRFDNSVSYTPEATSNILAFLKGGHPIAALNEIFAIYFDKNKYVDDPFVQNVQKINEISEGDKNNFYIFADNTAEVWSRYTAENSAFIYFYPANTGIVMIGALYEKSGQVYYGNDTTGFSNTWHSEKNNSRLNLATAIETTRKDGRRYLIYLHKNEMQVIDTQQESRS
jgi:hypothetical protein